jgi:hypothetical protein
MAENSQSHTVDAILSLWFGAPESADYGADWGPGLAASLIAMITIGRKVL